MTRRQLVSATGAAAAAALLPVAARADSTKIRIGHTLSPESEYQKWCQRFGEALAKNTNGRYELQIYPVSQLGGEVQMIQAVRAGTQEMLITSQPALEATVKSLEVFSTPFLFDSIEQGNRVMGGKVGQTFADIIARDGGLISMGWGSVQERNVFTTSKPIRSLADLQGMKLRIIQSPGYVEAYRALGANPTPMAYNQLYLALKEKVVDGADTSPDQFFMDKFAELCKYYHLTHVHYLPAGMYVGKTLWDGLDAKTKDAFLAAGRVAAPYNHQVYAADYKAGLAKMQSGGIEVIKPDLREWKNATKDVYKKFEDAIPNGKQLYEMIVAAKG
ncbi:MAG TPA: TRAP transporter substrate-binding protein [Candidatus Elarobacter sp.]